MCFFLIISINWGIVKKCFYFEGLERSLYIYFNFNFIYIFGVCFILFVKILKFLFILIKMFLVKLVIWDKIYFFWVGEFRVIKIIFGCVMSIFLVIVLFFNILK